MCSPSQDPIVETCNVVFRGFTAGDALQGCDGGRDAVTHTTAPSSGVAVTVHPKPSSDVDAFSSNVCHEFPACIRVKVDQGWIPVMQVKATVPREGDVEVIFFESKFWFQKVRPQGPCLLLNQFKHPREVPV